MYSFIKKTTFLLLLAISITSCESHECEENIISEEQEISTDLAEKIIATANSVNDYKFLVSKAAESHCEFPSMRCSFSNTEGDYYVFNTYAESLTDWLATYLEIKEQAYEITGIIFSNEDFF